MAKISNVFGAINSALRKDEGVFDCPLHDVSADPKQPRKRFEPAEIDRLAASIRDVGLLQPLVVRKAGPGEATTPYIIVAGERRFRAMTQLGWDRARVCLYGRTHGYLVASLVENVVRCDLNAMELANTYSVLKDRGMPTRELAEVVGKDRTHVQNTLRLLELPTDVQQWVSDGSLAPASARALLLLSEYPELLLVAAERVIEEGLSAPQTKQLCERLLPNSAPKKRTPPPPPPEAVELQQLFSERFGAQCQIKAGRRQITITLSTDGDTPEQMSGMLGQVTDAIRSA